VRHLAHAHIRSLVTLSVALAAAALIAAGATFAKHPTRRLTVVLSPAGLGTVEIRPGNRVCRVRCVVRYRNGTRARLRVVGLSSATFAGWSGACSGHVGCSVRLTQARRVVARFLPAPTLSSWSPHTTCTAVLTSLPVVLGSTLGPGGGAAETGGAFQPHLRGAQRHLLNPPCLLGKEPTFVEIDGLVVGKDWEQVESDGDYAGTLADASRPAIKNPYLKAIHAEIDGTWSQAGVAPPVLPPPGTTIDVQGFVYWDPGHEHQAFHNFSGWELHPLSAWRLSATGPSNRASALAAIAPAGEVAPAAGRKER